MYKRTDTCCYTDQGMAGVAGSPRHRKYELRRVNTPDIRWLLPSIDNMLKKDKTIKLKL